MPWSSDMGFNVVWWHGHPTIMNRIPYHGNRNSSLIGGWPSHVVIMAHGVIDLDKPLWIRPIIHPYCWEGAWLGGTPRCPWCDGFTASNFGQHWWQTVCFVMIHLRNMSLIKIWEWQAWILQPGVHKCWQRSYIEPKFDPHPCSWKPLTCIYIYIYN